MLGILECKGGKVVARSLDCRYIFGILACGGGSAYAAARILCGDDPI